MSEQDLPQKEEIKAWLSSTNRNREWLAEQLGTTKSVVDSWFSSRGFPRERLIAISEMMPESQDSESIVRVPFSDEQLEKAVKAASIVSAEFQEFCSRAIQHHAEELIAAKSSPVQYDFENPARMIAQPAHIMAAAGPGISAEVIDWKEGDEVVRVRVCGTSMEPTLTEGQIVEMRHKSASRSPFMKKGVIYLVQLDGDWMVKRYATRTPRPEETEAEFLTSSGMVGVLRSDNPAFSDIDITRPFEWAAWMDEPEPKK